MNLVKNFSAYNKTFLAGILASLLAGVTTPLFAGVFSVTPVRIYMTPKDRAVAVTVVNEGDEELVMQADLFLWEQKSNGEDVLTLTEDLFLSPPIIKMAPKSRQVVRLARLNAAKASEQQTYRMIVREIPEARPAKELQLQIALAFSMPIFITPPNTKPKLICQLEQGTADAVKAVCENTGNAYSHPTQLVVTNEAGVKIASDESGAYLLPGVKRSFEMRRTDGNSATGKAKLSITYDDATTQDYDVVITN